MLVGGSKRIMIAFWGICSHQVENLLLLALRVITLFTALGVMMGKTRLLTPHELFPSLPNNLSLPLHHQYLARQALP